MPDPPGAQTTTTDLPWIGATARTLWVQLNRDIVVDRQNYALKTPLIPVVSTLHDDHVTVDQGDILAVSPIPAQSHSRTSMKNGSQPPYWPNLKPALGPFEKSKHWIQNTMSWSVQAKNEEAIHYWCPWKDSSVVILPAKTSPCRKMIRMPHPTIRPVCSWKASPLDWSSAVRPHLSTSPQKTNRSHGIWLTGCCEDESLIDIRSKTRTPDTFELPDAELVQRLKRTNLLAGTVLLYLLGTLIWMVRVRPWAVPPGGGKTGWQQTQLKLKAIVGDGGPSLANRLAAWGQAIAKSMRPRPKTLALLGSHCWWVSRFGRKEHSI